MMMKGQRLVLKLFVVQSNKVRPMKASQLGITGLKDHGQGSKNKHTLEPQLLILKYFTSYKLIELMFT